MPRARTPRTPATRSERTVPEAAANRPTAPGPSPRRSALERCVGDVDHFVRNVWGAVPSHHRNDEDFSDVLTVDDVDEIISSAVRRPEVRLAQAGTILDENVFCTPVRIGGRQLRDVADAEAVARALVDGATVILQSLHRTRPSVDAFAADLEAALSHPVQANAYLTPPGSTGLAAHADHHDVFVLQLHGKKYWEVDGLGDIEVTVGDTLYLPGQTRHRATTGDSASLHLTIGVIPVTLRAVVKRVLDDIDHLDQALPVGYLDRQHEVEQLIAMSLHRVRDALGDIEAAAVAASERNRRRPRNRHAGRVSDTVRSTDLDLDSRIRLRPGLTIAVDDIADGAIRLTAGPVRLRLPATARAALTCIARANGPVCVGDLPNLDPPSRIVVARRLVAEGVCTISVPNQTGQ